jgi:hypothetical protein
MNYIKTIWTNLSGRKISAENLNKMERGIAAANGFETADDIRGLVSLDLFEVVRLNGSQGGEFHWMQGSVESEDGVVSEGEKSAGTVIKLNDTSVNGAYIRKIDGGINANWFSDVLSSESLASAISAAEKFEVNEVYIFDGGSVDCVHINKNVTLRGAGRKQSNLTITGTMLYDGIAASLVCSGITDNTGYCGVMDLTINVTANDGIGALITRKNHWRDVSIQGADGDGIRFRALDTELESPYFSRFENVWSKSNGGEGLALTENCNGNMFINCQFDSNQEHGVRQFLEGRAGVNQAVYGNIFINGQASYNQKNGYYPEKGSDFHIVNAYAEFNSQIDGGNPKTGGYKNLQLGASVARVNCVMGGLGTGTDLVLTIGLNTVTSNLVMAGGELISNYQDISIGYPNVGSGREINFHGGAGCQHSVNFWEAGSVIFKLKYNGVPSNPTNMLEIIPVVNGVDGQAILSMKNNGQLAFHGANPVSKAVVSGDTAGNQALISLIQALEDKGLISIS